MMVQYREIIQRFSSPNHYLLDAGCGRSSPARAKGRYELVVGIDSDMGISKNPDVEIAVIGDLGNLPFRECTFNIVVASWVIEHLSDPQTVLVEFNRVLKDEGVVVLLTPNLLHYATLLTSLMPHWFQKWFWLRLLESSAEENFPTFYRANTPKSLVSVTRGAGFKEVEMKLLDPGPVYLDWLAPAYAVGLIYHRLVNHFEGLSSFRHTLIGVFRKEVTYEFAS